ncbi:MAG: DUF4844 domain-containing protein [Pseudomonadota bacterium]
MVLTEIQRAQLAVFIAQSKFMPEGDYVGYGSEDVLALPNDPLNDVAREVLRRGSFTKDKFLDRAIEKLHLFDLADTEDRERAYAAVERLMDILGIASSDGRLNEALYGRKIEPGGAP